jgi:amino-acid N-acetyltransferase
MSIQLRPATAGDGASVHALISTNLTAGHLLPRSLGDIEAHVERFIVAVDGETVIGCAELAPLSDVVAEVRSLVVDEGRRGAGTGAALVTAVGERARALGFVSLCAFTHEPGHFVRLGFSIVPHLWVPEKIAHDCVGCSQFRQCGQYAVSLALRAKATIRTYERSAVRAVPRPRASVERLRLPLTPVHDDREPIPA